MIVFVYLWSFIKYATVRYYVFCGQSDDCCVSGTSASAVHFQAYLVEGLVRWNAARTRAALQRREDGGGTREGEGHLSNLEWLDVRHQHRLTELTPPGHTPLLRNYRAPREYTGEILTSFCFYTYMRQCS